MTLDTPIRVIPLGGVGEIGKNLTVFEYGDDIILVDCGVLFPEPEMLGVDLVIPDVSYLAANQQKIRGVVMTHGHEDHTGALPFVLPQIGFPPVYATQLTAGLIRVKLKEHKLTDRTHVQVVDPDETLHLGAMTVQFFRVNHSIPDAVGVVIRTPAGIVVHTGDFKFDQTPIDGRRTDFNRLAALGDEGVTLLLSDSTNSERPGYTPSEMVVGAGIQRIVAEAPGRVIIATFASLIARMQQVLDAAERYDRKVSILGRSMVDNASMALELGYLRPRNPGVLVRPDEALRLPDNEVIFLTTGSQGEPTSALSRMANGDHKQIRIKAGDTVIISASPIPGNEELVNRVIDNLYKLGATVYHSGMSQVHVSGHAAQEEQKMLLALVRPRYFMPVHGEWRHLILHSRTAQAMGVDPEHCFIMENGDVLEVTRDSARKAGKVDAGYVYVDGLVGGVGHVVLRDRRALAQDGIFVVVVAVDNQTGRVVGRPDIVSRGFVDMRESEALIEGSRQVVLDALAKDGDSFLDWGRVHARVKDAVSAYLYEHTRRRPIVLPVALEV